MTGAMIHELIVGIFGSLRGFLFALAAVLAMIFARYYENRAADLTAQAAELRLSNTALVELAKTNEEVIGQLRNANEAFASIATKAVIAQKEAADKLAAETTAHKIAITKIRAERDNLYKENENAKRWGDSAMPFDLYRSLQTEGFDSHRDDRGEGSGFGAIESCDNHNSAASGAACAALHGYGSAGALQPAIDRLCFGAAGMGAGS